MENINLIDYYKKHYGIKIRHINQPLLVSTFSDSRSIHLVPELCLVTGMDEDMRNSMSFKRDLMDSLKMKHEGKV